jgi:hypothetical protein
VAVARALRLTREDRAGPVPLVAVRAATVALARSPLGMPTIFTERALALITRAYRAPLLALTRTR